MALTRYRGKESAMTDETAAQDAEQPVLDLLAEMTAASLERSTLDPLTLMHVRIAALVATEAPPLSYLMNLSAASEMGVTTEQIQGILIAIAPIVGTTRVVAATGAILRALGLAISPVSEEELQD